jgi:hypothetical protein
MLESKPSHFVQPSARLVALPSTNREDPMSHVRLSAITIAGAIVTTIIVGVVMVSRPARAQSTGKAQCAENQTSAAQVQAWMNQQIAAGRTRFVGFTSLGGAELCAW